MKKNSIFLFALLLTSSAIAQNAQPCSTCLTEGITFTTQAQINSFPVNYPGCTEIDGDVIIMGADIDNLSGLNALMSIGGNLSINTCPSLTCLNGLENLTSIGISLYVNCNYALTSLTGLENVNSIGGDLQIGDSWYGGNPVLTSLAGLQSLTSIGGDLWFWDNDALTSLAGLEGLTSIGDLWIQSNGSLTSLAGLDNITSIGGILYIGSNNALTSLAGLDQVDANTISDLYISGNHSLTTCTTQCICNYLAAPNGGVEICDNATCCNCPEEVDSACAYLSTGNISDHSEVSIYPNPSSDHITIDLPESISIHNNLTLAIFNFNGQQLLKRQITEQQTVVDVSGLPQGVYFVSVVDKRAVMGEKFVKQ